MSSILIQRFPDAEHVSQAAAEVFVRLAKESIAARGRFTVALAGGSTPRRLYQLLAEALWRDQVDWPRVEFFWGDERSVPPDHADSNYRMANEALLQKIPVQSGHVHRMQAERMDRDRAATEYQAEIARVFGVKLEGEPPAFDLILLGMGPDGHTASLFPHTTALKENKRWVVVNYVDKFKNERVTLTTRILNRAANVYFLVAGADKTDRLVEVLEGPPESDRLPSQLIRPAGNLVWLVDASAAARLSPSSLT